jgi:hypothetical protein
LKEFKTDGCSGGMSWVWNLVTGHGPPWEGCCVTHDKHYWAGGSKQDRKDADKALRVCVAKNGYPIWAWIMWIAVRLGGGPRWPSRYRWGFGAERYLTESLIKGYGRWESKKPRDESRYPRLP